MGCVTDPGCDHLEARGLFVAPGEKVPPPPAPAGMGMQGPQSRASPLRQLCPSPCVAPPAGDSSMCAARAGRGASHGARCCGRTVAGRARKSLRFVARDSPSPVRGGPVGSEHVPLRVRSPWQGQPRVSAHAAVTNSEGVGFSVTRAYARSTSETSDRGRRWDGDRAGWFSAARVDLATCSCPFKRLPELRNETRFSGFSHFCATWKLEQTQRGRGQSRRAQQGGGLQA